MELNIQRQPIAACERMLATTAEHPIECDVLLPDYCPDIVRVLSCQVAGAVTDATVRGSNFAVDGMATVTLWYWGDAGGVRRTEYRIPFSKTFELTGEPSDPVYSVTVEQGYLHCRAVSKRRLDIRGTLVLSVWLCDTAEQEVLCAAEGMGVQLRLSESSGIRVGDQTLRSFTIREDLVPAPGKSPVAELVYAQGHPVVQDCHVVAGRAVLKGELLLHLLYKTDRESGALETCDYTLPISQLLELNGAEDDVRCEAALDCVSLVCTPDEDLAPGEGRMQVEAQVVASMCLIHPVELVGATDSFSTLYMTDSQIRQLRIPRLLATVSERASIREQAKLPEQTESIADVWVAVSKAVSRWEDGRLTASCRLIFTILCETAESQAECVTHTCEAAVALSVADANEQSEFSPHFTVMAASGTAAGGMASLSCELLVTGMVLGYETKRLLTALTVNAEAPRKTDPSVGLRIYYARAGENVWDISKRYGALPTKVLADNGLTDGEIAQNTALIIPTA